MVNFECWNTKGFSLSSLVEVKIKTNIFDVIFFFNFNLKFSLITYKNTYTKKLYNVN